MYFDVALCAWPRWILGCVLAHGRHDCTCRCYFASAKAKHPGVLIPQFLRAEGADLNGKPSELLKVLRMLHTLCGFDSCVFGSRKPLKYAVFWLTGLSRLPASQNTAIPASSPGILYTVVAEAVTERCMNHKCLDIKIQIIEVSLLQQLRATTPGRKSWPTFPAVTWDP